MLFVAGFLITVGKGYAQTAKADLSINVSGALLNNSIPRVGVKVKTKIDGRFQNVAGITLALYLDKDSAGYLIDRVTTNNDGEAAAYLSPVLKQKWGNRTLKHTFIAVFNGDKNFEATKGDVTVLRGKINLSISPDKKVTATVYSMTDTSWTPQKGVDVKLAIARLGGDLPINETPTFTTDSTGQVSADFKRDSIPGDINGNITLIARVEDNDQIGSLSVEKVVAWGAKFKPVNNFDKRSLYATRDKAPVWLQLLAYSIMLSVWAILAYLVFNVIKIKRSVVNNT